MILGDAVIATNSDHQILELNREYEQACGYNHSQLIGKKAEFIKSGLTPKYVYNALKESLSQNKSWMGILTNRKPDGYLWNPPLITGIIC
ncbi:PAS domain-containing protein [Fodinisporobacter ferrooxydans]|uniref:PAS domain-containing protein n=1 Tax=Fodinisporobacter ferrooxydans TaxID=2901836 RepID=UPI003D319B57